MDITKLFKSKTREAVFRTFFTNPDNEFYLRELERQLNTPASMLRKELLTLEKEGILLSRKAANLIYYSINKNYPLYKELKSIVFKTVGVEGLLKDSLSKIPGIKLAFIYGSVANKSESASSDIDIFIVGDIDERGIIKVLRKLEFELKREVNYILYSPDEFRQKRKNKNAFIGEVLRNKRIFLIGDKNDL